MSAPTRIVAADIGGTHARFAIAEVADGKVVSLSEPTRMACADHASFQTAWEAYGETLDEPLPRAASIALAAPITGDLIKLSNNPWVVRPALVNRKLGLDTHLLLNDFAAVAHAVDAVGPEHLAHVTGPEAALPDDGIVSIIGPGTGLGVAMLARIGARGHVFATEGGHSDFAPLDRIEDRLLERLRGEHTRVSVERVVAGPGIRPILETIAEIEGRPMPQGDDKALWTMALAGENSLAEAALDRFCQCLGAVAGDVALTHGPGPVVLAGGLGLRLAEILPQSGFAERFAAKGRYRKLMEQQTVSIITHPEPGLFGAAAAFAKEHT
jgi:glucokinase